jgi:uncharacterized protein (TIGR03435 family)
MRTRASHQTTSRPCSFALGFITILGLALVAVSAQGQTMAQSAVAAQIAPARPAASAPAPQQAFEVASIRLVEPHSIVDLQRGIGVYSINSFPSNLLTIRNTDLKYLISMAYGFDSNRIVGTPGWIESQEYDLSAKVEGNVLFTQEQMRPLLQKLLEERFHLTTHRESKEESGYALVVAKGGPKLQPNKGTPQRGVIVPGELRIQNQPVKSFAVMLAFPLRQPVEDKTGIDGMYDFDLKFAPANAREGSADAALPSIFTAVQEQYGLKLVPQKVPVDFLVVDHVDRTPTEN